MRPFWRRIVSRPFWVRAVSRPFWGRVVSRPCQGLVVSRSFWGQVVSRQFWRRVIHGVELPAKCKFWLSRTRAAFWLTASANSNNLKTLVGQRIFSNLKFDFMGQETIIKKRKEQFIGQYTLFEKMWLGCLLLTVGWLNPKRIIL